MTPWITVAVSGGLLLAVVIYAVLHFVPSKYTVPVQSELAGIDDGVYVFLNPG